MSTEEKLFQHDPNAVCVAINNRITDPRKLKTAMDSQADFGDDVEFLVLYRKFCRHVYCTYPKIVGENAAPFRALFVTSEDSQEGS